MAIAWGLLSTAHINLKVLAGARASDSVDVVAVASRGRRPGRKPSRASTGSPAPTAPTRRSSATPTWTPCTSRSRTGSTSSGRSARSRPGKHVLIEKPFSRWPDEVARAFDVADRAGLLLSEAFMWRHHPQTARLVELIAEGAIGRLQHIPLGVRLRPHEPRATIPTSAFRPTSRAARSWTWAATA